VARYQGILAYDGTGFAGFQRQRRNQARTVQSVFEDALRQLGWQGRAILGAGRTDSGVHASGQVVAFDLDWSHSLQDLQAALNRYLPPDAAVRGIALAGSDFHPRYDAVARRYRYRIFCEPWRDPLRERYAWRVWPALDLEALQAAARALVGVHDFAAFGTPPRKESSSIRYVSRAEWFGQGSDLEFEVQANAFLYHMVRRLVFVQVAVGQGRLDLDSLRAGLHSPAAMFQGLAPPQGLTLVQVLYGEDSPGEESTGPSQPD
jgi:tRNA pseudouridine38-40 synthase